jgi:signal transduction histidine kinase/ActR/RegA family two-component response regulator
MKSTMQAYREVCYLDLHQNSFYIVYPEDVERARAGRYQEGLKNLFRIGILQCREEDEAERVLGMENIKTELKEKDYIEVRCGHRSKDGEIESCVITVSVTDRVDGEPVSATLAIRSIENVLRQEQAQREILTMAVQRAEAANHAKSDFLSNMSHDIRTPLNAILGMTEIARIHIGEKDRVEDALNKIAVSGKHLLGLVNSVLDMSKIENGKITLEEADFDLYETIDEIQTLFLGQLQEKDLHFLMEKEEITHRYVYGDEQRLSRIFVNIMGNAVKFTPAGGKIFFLAREKNSDIPGRGFYEFVFEDSGIGMTQEFMDHIFEPFTRAVDSRTNRIEGTGLGMPIAVNVAKMMGGDIKVESQPGKGSRFTVTVYLKIKDSLEMEENPENESGLKSLGECDFSGKKVLLVEDNELNVEVASEILAIAGFEVTTAKNGKEAVEIFAGKDMGYFDLILMDVQMPVMNGYEATREIRHLQREDAWSIPIIAMTANAFADDIQDAMEAGMNAHLSKPLDIHKLKQCLKEFF